ncbi:MAG: flagellar hook-basal body complex protein [Rubellimicrobium sp.]|nr:flagellar hook-basal body complex protein [Rubellimicrobium sp.]
MTLSSSMNAGVAGLAANATRLGSISDNIANSGTFGYKRVETDFHAMVVGSGKGTYTAGGVRTSTIRLIDKGGPLVTTSNATDLAVRGRGMLPVTPFAALLAGQANPPMLMTTTGSFHIDELGYLKSTSGHVLLGWPAAADGSVPEQSRVSSAGLQPVRINFSQVIGQPTTALTLLANLPATETIAGAGGDPHDLTIDYFDNLGVPASITATFTPTVPAAGASNEWTLELKDEAQGGLVIGDYTLTFDDTRGGGGTLLSVADNVGGAYDPASGSFTVNVAGGPIQVQVGRIGTAGGMTQLSDIFSPIQLSQDGSAAGTITAIEVDENGFVHAQFSTGLTRVLYQVPLVDVPNPNGLQALDGQTYAVSRTSGAFYLWNAGDGPTGEVVSFAREESTTDIAAELTGLITTQRAYSSNAKVIQTVDEMLQETSNIKR